MSSERQEARDPNTSAARLITLARKHPLQVAKNPALSLIALEDPATYARLESALKHQLAMWLLSERHAALSPRGQRLFACECAALALPRYEAAYPGDRRPAAAIAAARDFAEGAAAPAQLSAARVGARSAYQEAWAACTQRMRSGAAGTLEMAAVSAAQSAAHAASRDPGRAAVQAAVFAAQALSQEGYERGAEAGQATFAAALYGLLGAFGRRLAEEGLALDALPWPAP